MASFSSSQSTQPFSDASQPLDDLQQLISDIAQTTNLSFIRIFARCCLHKRYLSISTHPDKAQAANLGHDILGVSQSIRSTGCDIQIPMLDNDVSGAHLRLFFDPARDHITAQNISNTSAVMLQPASSSARSRRLTPGQCMDLEPGPWTLSTCPTPETIRLPPKDMVDLVLQPRQSSASSLEPAPGPSTRAGAKRHRDTDISSIKKTAVGQRQIDASSAAHPLIQLSDGETVYVKGQHREDNYWLTRERQLTTTGSAVLYTAQYSQRPGQIVLAKALKVSKSAYSTAEQWRREVSAHGGIGRHASCDHAASSQVLIPRFTMLTSEQ